LQKPSPNSLNYWRICFKSYTETTKLLHISNKSTQVVSNLTLKQQTPRHIIKDLIFNNPLNC